MPMRIKSLLLLTGLVTALLLWRPARGEEVTLYDYILKDLDGKETTLAPYKGRVLVLEFFATWCPPCRKDLPQIAALQASYPPEKVTFLAISADATTATVNSLPFFIRDTGLKIPVLVGGSIFVDKYAGVDKAGGREVILPETYVFDGKGDLAVRLVGEQKAKTKNLTETLERLLKGSSS